MKRLPLKPALYIVGLCASMLTPRVAVGEQFNRRNLLPGGRAATMGGAYSGISDDASGSWYNPAGLAFTKGSDVSMSANAFTKTHRSISGALGGNDVAEASTSIYPAFAGGTAGLGPIRFGYSFFTSDHDNTDDSFRFQVPASGNVAAYTYSRRLLATGDMLYAGASASFSLGPNLALGLGQFYYRRTRQASLIESSVYTTGASFDSNIRQSTLNEGTVTTAGIMVRGAGFSWGLSARLPKRLADSTLVESSQTTYAGSAQDRAESSSKPHAFDEITPPEYTMGLAWQPSNWLLIATDYIHIPAEKSPHEDSDGVNTTQSRNWALGCELSGGPLALRGGIFTNNSLVNEPSPSKVDQPAWINFRGFSAGLGWRRKSSEAALGIVKQIGSGTDQSVSGSSALFSIEAESTTYLLTNRFTLP